jgi:hypothetical protein
MFRIYYETKIRNFDKVLYNPTLLHKTYNYIYCRDIDLNSVQAGETFYIGNLEQQVLEKDDEGFFISPGLYTPNPFDKKDFKISFLGNDHNLSFNAFSSFNSILIGSLVYPETNTFISAGDQARIVDIHNNIVHLKTVDITNLQHVDSQYFTDTVSTVLKFNKSLELCDWLNKTNTMSIYSLDTTIEDIDMNVYFRCYGGYPIVDFTVNPMPQYKLEITDLDTEETVSKNIFQFHSEKISAKHRYLIVVKDQLNERPALVNDSSSDGNIYVDFSTMDNFTMMAQQKIPVRKTLSEIAEPLFSKRVR